MKTIPSTIDVLKDGNEICWIVTIPNQNASQAALQLAALHCAMVPEICFRDIDKKESFVITRETASLSNQKLPITSVWLEAALHLLLNAALNGWTDTAHLDQTFPGKSGNVSITINIAL